MYSVIETVVCLIIAIILDKFIPIENTGLYFFLGYLGISIAIKLDTIMILLFSDDIDIDDDDDYRF